MNRDRDIHSTPSILFFTYITLTHIVFFFFFNDTATTEIYTLSLHDALPIYLAHALARVDEVGHAQPGAHVAHGGRVLHQPRIGRHPCDSDELGAGMAREATHALGIHAPLGEIVGAHGLDSRAARQRQVHELVRGIIRTRGDDAVARVEIERRERLRERDRGVLHDRDVAGRGADHLCDPSITLPHARVGFIRRLVAADQRFPFQVAGERLQHRPRHERRAGVVEMDALPAAGGVFAPAREQGRGRVGRHGRRRDAVSYTRFRTTNHTFAGRSASRRMYHANQAVP